jgi:hypothetical protein
LVCALILSSLLAACGWSDVTLIIANAGNAPMTDIVVRVTGNDFSNGDLETGGSTMMRLSVTGDSHVRIESASGDPLVPDVYLQRGEPGTIRAVVTPDSVVSVEHVRGRSRH